MENFILLSHRNFANFRGENMQNFAGSALAKGLFASFLAKSQIDLIELAIISTQQTVDEDFILLMYLLTIF